MREPTFLKLIDKHLNGNATPGEQRLLEEYYKRLDAKGKTSLAPEQELVLQQIMQENIQKCMHTSVPDEKRRKIRYLFRYIVAASILMIISAGLYLYQPTSPRLAKQNYLPKNYIVPGGNKATLTLADGSKVVLEEMKNGLLAKQNGITISKTVDGMVKYGTIKPDNEIKQIAYNILETPRGGQYQISLPDGSKVWLNSSSSLKFPVVFAEKSRNVELKGEAYFEITKNKNAPFKVIVNDAKIEVLGTHFNVMAYADENSITTTLLEGSVRVSMSNESKLIVPGEQLILTDKMKVAKADIMEAVAWKNGYFIFKNEDIQSVMRKISRWYNVDIEYQNTVPKKSFLGKISRKGNISDLLEMLELTGSVHFKILPGGSLGKAGKVIVTP